ncbi:MAG: nicotinamide riboside transporter PnuC [Gammaproteobacteria bacterium]|nr:nicotinamide riboside transporter PnuC [Gammaproteobacteria bacterium]
MFTLEIIAVVLAIAYLLLAAREHIACWYCAFVSSAIFSVIFWDVSLLMESLLNVFYVVMAVVGWYEWRRGGQEHTGVTIRTLAAWQHGMIIAVLIVAALINGYFLQMYTGASWPYLDSFTTWASVLTTFMIVWKVLENWLYWFVIDGISIYLYVDRGLTLTAMLFVVYLVIVIFGFLQWRRRYNLQKH